MVNESSSIRVPQRSAGLEIPVFAIPRPGDLGAGDTGCVHQVIDLAAMLGLGSLTLLPIQETVKGNDPSVPVSVFSLDPMLLDLHPKVLPDLTEEAFHKLAGDQATSQLKPNNQLPYHRVKRLKLDLLWQAFEHFWKHHHQTGSQRARDYHRFCIEHATWLPDYCLYRLLMDFEQGKERWEDWSDEYACYGDAKRFIADIAANKPAAVERQLAYYGYVQWVAYRQWQGVREHADECQLQLITDVHCAISPHCAEFFKSPESFRLESGQSAVWDGDLLEHLENRLMGLSGVFSQFRVPDFRKTTSLLEGVDDETIKKFIATAAIAAESDSSSTPIKVAWESLPAMAMQSSSLWPAPNGRLNPPMPGAQMSFSSFGGNSLRRLWSNNMLFRRRLKNQWAVNTSTYDLSTTSALMRKLLQYPARHIQISYQDLAGLENEPGVSWLARYDKGVDDLLEEPAWEDFCNEFRKILKHTGRLARSPEKISKTE